MDCSINTAGAAAAPAAVVFNVTLPNIPSLLYSIHRALQFNAFFDGIKIINLLNRWLYKRKEETTTRRQRKREREKSVNFVCMAHAL